VSECNKSDTHDCCGQRQQEEEKPTSNFIFKAVISLSAVIRVVAWEAVKFWGLRQQGTEKWMIIIS